MTLHRQHIAIMRTLQPCAYDSKVTTILMKIHKSPNPGPVRTTRVTNRMMQVATCRSMHHQQMCYFWMCCCAYAYTTACLMRTFRSALVSPETRVELHAHLLQYRCIYRIAI